MDDLIYARVSTREQSDSLPVQEKKSKDFAKAQNLNVTHVFTDAESARTTGRPQLQALLAFCKKHKGNIGNVIVADLSRSEERRVGKECRSRWALYRLK